jgi:FimV-like protein
MRKIAIGIICSFFITTGVLADLETTSNPSQATVDDLNNRLIIVEDKNNTLQAQISQIEERLNAIEQKMEQPKETNLIEQEGFVGKFIIAFKPVQQYIEKLAERLGIDQRLLISAIIGVIVLLLIYLLCRCRCSCGVVRSATVCSHAKDEYNILENQEGITAKLNLARAYIAMGKTTEAQNMLQEALANGSPAEQIEAKELLERIKRS